MGKCIIRIIILTSMRSLNCAQETTTPFDYAQNECDGYCYKMLKPMLELIGTMQQYWKTCNTSQVGNIQSRLNRLERQMVMQQEKAVSCLTAIAETKHNLVEQEKLIDIHKKSVSKPFQQI